MNITTPALLFPAISLLLLAYTNRFLTLGQLIRQLAADTREDRRLIARQIPGLKRRITQIRFMQTFAVISFLLCALSMLAIFADYNGLGKALFGASITTLTLSLVLSLFEVLISTQALSVVVEDLEERTPPAD
ncbi:MAG: DUF2721 domain-containing protein [Rhodocyclaceae bacterium]|nr:DUF2721 domain-containing protein [Rhodocyclaceae bacterium]